jgi:hypothetical protein
VLLQASRQNADVPEMRGREAPVDEPPLEPAKQDADARLGHTLVVRHDHE